MVCDKYKEQRALYFVLWLCCAFSQHSDVSDSTPIMERRSSCGKSMLQKMKFQRNCWRTHYMMFLTTLIVTVKVTVKMTVTLLLLEIRKRKLCNLYRAAGE